MNNRKTNQLDRIPEIDPSACTNPLYNKDGILNL